MRRQHDAKTERGQTWIGIAETVFGSAAVVPGGEHAEHLGEVFDEDFRAQFVEINLATRAVQSARHIEKKSAAVFRRGLGDDEIGDDFALRRQQRAKPRRSGRELENVGGD